MIYFIQVENNGPIKIGPAVDPEKRLNNLQIGNHKKLNLIAVIPGKSRLESKIHRDLKEFRRDGVKWPHCRCQNNGKISKIIESHRHSFSRNRPQPALHNRDSGEVVGDYRNGYNELIHRKELVPSGTVSDKHLHT